MTGVEINVTYDGTGEFLSKMRDISETDSVRTRAMIACMELTQDYLRALPPNKRGWPSQGFWQGAAAGTTGELTPDGFHILIDNEDAPGAVRFRHYCHVNGSGKPRCGGERMRGNAARASPA